MLPAAYATPATGVLLLSGLLACFAGYRLFRLVLAIFGFILGAVVTTQHFGPASTMFTLALAALVGGLVGAVLAVVAYFMGVGLVGAGLAALAINVVWHFIGGDPPTWVLVIGCVVGALAALSVVRYVIVFGTALMGSWTIIVAALALAGDPAAHRAANAGDIWILYPLDPLWAGRWWYVPAWLALALVGIIFQLGTTRPGGRAKPKKT